MATICEQNDNIKVILTNIAKIEQKENKKKPIFNAVWGLRGGPVWLYLENINEKIGVLWLNK